MSWQVSYVDCTLCSVFHSINYIDVDTFHLVDLNSCMVIVFKLIKKISFPSDLFVLFLSQNADSSK